MESLLTVRGLLEMKTFEKHRVIAGEDGLDNPVRRITALELPDALDWITADEIVCTSGFYLIDDPETQAKWIKTMSRKKLAALIIKPERFLKSTPQTMIDTANACGFPIIELPLRVTWAEIIEEVMAVLLEMQVRQLKKSYDVQRSLMQMLLDSKPIGEVIASIAELVSLPVLLEDRYLNLLLVSQPPAGGFDAMCRVVSTAPFRSTSNLSYGREGESPFHVAEDSGSRIFAVGKSVAGVDFQQMTIPLSTGKYMFGYLSILAPDKRDDTLLRTVLEHASTVVTLMMLIALEKTSSVMAERNDLLRTIVEANDVPHEKILRTSGAYGLNLNSPTVILKLSLDSELSLLALQSLENMLHERDREGFLFCQDLDMTMFFHPPANVGHQRAAAKCRDFAHLVGHSLKPSGVGFHIGISERYEGIPGIRQGYQEAVQCLAKAKKQGKAIVESSELGIEKMFSLTRNSDELKKYAVSNLKKLIDYEGGVHGELMSTLRAYLESRSVQTKAAKALNIHLNTLKYRLQRIEDILETSLDDMEKCTILYIALRALED